MNIDDITPLEVDVLADMAADALSANGKFLVDWGLRQFAKEFLVQLGRAASDEYRAVGWVGENGVFNQGCPPLNIATSWQPLLVREETSK